MDEIILEYYDSLNYYGYTKKEANNLLKMIYKKYGNLTENEIKEVLYNAMNSCLEEKELTIEERLIHIDGLWYTSKKYAKYRYLIKNYLVDDLVKIMINAFEKEQGDFLTEKEKEIMKLGIITNCININEIEEKIKKKRL